MKPDAPLARTAGASEPVEATPIRSQPSTLNSQPPDVPDHELLRLIGRGSYGEVWLARSLLGTWRAVKIVRRSAFEDDTPFRREFHGIAKFEPLSRTHEGLVGILQVGANEAEGYFYCVMELADSVSSDQSSVISNRSAETAQTSGKTQPLNTERLTTEYCPKTLRSEIKRHGPLPPGECITIGLALANALAHLHKNGLVHRDIKPSNIIFIGGTPRLADIGLVTGLDATRTYVGTEGFMAPEGPGSPQADIYSLGKVLYEMATGKDRHDFPDLPTALRAGPTPEPSSSRRKEAHSSKSEIRNAKSDLDQSLLPSAVTVQENDTRLPGVAREALLELNEIFTKACASDPRQRYQSAEAMHAELALLQQGRSVKRQRELTRRKVLARWLAIATLFVLMAGSVGWLFSERHSAEKQRRRQQANEYVLQGKQERLKETKESLARAIEMFNRTIEIDPDYAEPYLGLTYAYWSSADWHLPSKQAMSEAKKAARRAVQIANQSPEAHAALGMVRLYYDWDWPGAEKEYKRAVELNLDDHGAHEGMATFLRAMGRVEEARAAQARACQLAPSNVLSGMLLQFYRDRDYEKTIEFSHRMLATDPKSIIAHVFLGRAYGQRQMHDEAIELFRQVRRLDDGPDLIGELGFALAIGGRTNEALALLVELKSLSANRYVSPYFEAYIHAGLGQKTEALRCLRLAFEARSVNLVSGHFRGLTGDTHWDGLREEPEFRQLIREMGLPP